MVIAAETAKTAKSDHSTKSGVPAVDNLPKRPPRRHSEEDRYGRSGKRVASGLANAHPIVTVLAVIAGCYLILAVTLVVSGLAFTHLLAHGRIGHWDDHVNAWFAHHRSTTWNTVSADLTLLANTLGVVAVAVVVTLVLLIRRWGELAVLLIIALAVELSVFLTTNYLVARPRPSVPHLGSTPSTFSWPSGHSAATLVLYCGIALLVMIATPKRFPRVVAWVVAVSLTVCVAVSRVYRGEHHPTDTLAGVVLGIGALWAAVLAIRTWNRLEPRPRAGRPQSQPAGNTEVIGR